MNNVVSLNIYGSFVAIFLIVDLSLFSITLCLLSLLCMPSNHLFLEAGGPT